MKRLLMTSKGIGTYRWTICALIFFATTINYLDRQVISLLKPYLEKEFHWTESSYANAVIVFQITYAAGMFGAGRVVDWLGTRYGYALALSLWSIATMLHAFARSTSGFLFFRGFLGLAESANFPAAIKGVAEWFPKKERSFATGLLNSGTNVGAIIAPLIVPQIAGKYGWRMAFVFTGMIGFIWLIFWFWKFEIPSKHKKVSAKELAYIHSDSADDKIAGTEQLKPEIPWMRLLRFKQTWAFVIGKFLTDGIWWFFLFWLPAFLLSEYKLQNVQLGLPIALVYTMTCFGSIFGGYLPLWFQRTKGWSLVRARKTSMFIYALFPLPVVFAQLAGASNMWYAVLLIGIAASAHQAWSANIYTIVSDMFPKNSVASVIGIGGAAGALGGIVVAKLAGILFDFYKSAGHLQTGYYIMFFVCGLAYITAWLIMFRVLIPTMKPVNS